MARTKEASAKRGAGARANFCGWDGVGRHGRHVGPRPGHARALVRPQMGAAHKLTHGRTASVSLISRQTRDRVCRLSVCELESNG